MRRGLIAAPGYPFLLGGALLIFLGWALSWPWLSLAGLLGAGFFAYFFRDPQRLGPSDPAAIVSPADGKVVFLDEIQEDRFLHGPAKRLAIFMNVFDVHVNRAPVAGTVADIRHQPGKFKAAFLKEADRLNEQQATLLDRDKGGQVLVVQIAGLLARRIIGFVKPGQKLARGERLGMICFGSRVDLYLPPESEILVKVGDRLKAGSSTVGRWASV
ncbi:MAG: phosphatidylserine decarboxylase family protein [Desulfobaccales bacterium]|nr:phosphatidylserine decarboxylase family protein [Desulfobaccales bacterium]